ncbi:hypothetical protein FQA39_LY19365 [Lamprigera yunnana]|nr:hypothetical protein FQA39_LY19365 [Lamprigera yunnana]
MAERPFDFSSWCESVCHGSSAMVVVASTARRLSCAPALQPAVGIQDKLLYTCSFARPHDITMNITQDTAVTLQFKLTDTKGNSLGSGTLAYLHGGYENVFPKVEAALEGQAKGYAVTVDLAVEDAFGARDESLVRVIPKAEFPPGVKVGGQLRGVNDQGERPRSITWSRLNGPEVHLNGKPPAGRPGRALYRQSAEAVRAASAEEIAHGHAFCTWKQQRPGKKIPPVKGGREREWCRDQKWGVSVRSWTESFPAGVGCFDGCVGEVLDAQHPFVFALAAGEVAYAQVVGHESANTCFDKPGGGASAVQAQRGGDAQHGNVAVAAAILALGVPHRQAHVPMGRDGVAPPTGVRTRMGMVEPTVSDLALCSARPPCTYKVAFWRLSENCACAVALAPSRALNQAIGYEGNGVT